MGKRNAITPAATLWIVGVLFLSLFLFPLFSFYGGTLLNTSRGELFRGLISLLKQASFLRTLSFTVLQASISALASIVLALPGAYFLARYRFRLSRLINTLSLIPFVLPSIIVVICMISFYGRNGLISRLFHRDLRIIYSFAGIVTAHVFFNVSLALRMVSDGWRRIDAEIIDAARCGGAGFFAIFRRITLPLLVPPISAAFMLIFILCFFSFGVVLVFGGVRFATFEVRIYQELFYRLNLQRAWMYATAQLLFSALFIVVLNRFISSKQVESLDVSANSMENVTSIGTLKKTVLMLYWFLLLVFILGPLITMFARSLSPRGILSFDAYRDLFMKRTSGFSAEGILRTSVPKIIFTSLGIALLSGSSTFIIAFFAALLLRKKKGKQLNSVLQIPMGVSLVSFCVGLRLLLGGAVPKLTLVVAAQVFFAFPFVFRILKTSVDSVGSHLIEAAVLMGAGRIRVSWSVFFPILRTGMGNAFAYAFALSFADFTAVLTLGGGEIVTFPIAIYRLLGFRSFDLALSLSGVYVFFCLLLFLLLDRVSSTKDGVSAKRQTAP